MSNELLAIVQAEERAESILEEARRKKEQAIRQAREHREERLQRFRQPQPRPVQLKPLRPNLGKLKKLAKQNRDAAIRKILEEVHAAA